MSFRRAFQRFTSDRTCLRSCALLVILLLSGCATSEHDQTEIDRFQHAWAERREGYAAQWFLANAEVRRQSTAAEQLLANRGATAWPAVAQATAHVTGAVNHAFEIAGRRALLSRYIERMDSEPSASSMRRWLQAEAEQIGDDQEVIEERSAHFLAELRDDPISPGNLLREAEDLAAEQGLVRGRAKELGALYQSATAYFASLEDGDVEDLYADDDDRQIAAQALAGDIALNHAMIRQRMGQELAQPRSCRESGERILCVRSRGWMQTEFPVFPDERRRPLTG